MEKLLLFFRRGNRKERNRWQSLNACVSTSSIRGPAIPRAEAFPPIDSTPNPATTRGGGGGGRAKPNSTGKEEG